jgi:ABC-2 type transport system ATP-binding protein
VNAIATSELCKSYGNRQAVRDLTLQVREGELFSLLGINGAGKSTTIKMLCCLLRPTSGDAQILGHSILTEPQRCKELLNVSPQETAVAPKLTVRENLEFLAGIYGSDQKTAAAAAEETIERFAMQEIAKDKARTLSGGWQRRLSIAMALITKPRLLFLDEPTLGLDVLARRELWSVIGALKGHVTVILTTHYLEEAEALSDRIGILSRGRLVAAGTAKELIDRSGKDNFEDAFIALSQEKEAE